MELLVLGSGRRASRASFMANRKTQLVGAISVQFPSDILMSVLKSTNYIISQLG